MKIFNYRHSQACMLVECAFGILSSCWRMLQRYLILSPEMAGHMVHAVCVLHNILMKPSDHFTQSVEDNIHRLQQPIESQLEPLGAFRRYKTSFDVSQVRMIFTHFLSVQKAQFLGRTNLHTCQVSRMITGWRMTSQNEWILIQNDLFVLRPKCRTNIRQAQVLLQPK